MKIVKTKISKPTGKTTIKKKQQTTWKIKAENKNKQLLTKGERSKSANSPISKSTRRY